MDAIRRLPGSIERVGNTIVSELKTRLGGQKNVDCVFVIGPREGDMADSLRRIAQSQGLSYAIIGDGKQAITEAMIINARRAGVIGKDSEVFSASHGGLSGPKAHRQHGLELGADGDSVSPRELISWFRKPLGDANGPGAEQQPWGGNIHVLACHVGKFRDEFKPADDGQAGLWEQGMVFLHGSGKMLYTDAGIGDVETVVREIAVAKRLDGKRPDSMQIMRALMDRQTDTVTLMGGALDQPLVMRAPKSVAEIMTGDLQAQWRQQDAQHRLDLLEGRISGADRTRAALMEARAASTRGPVSLKVAVNVLFTRLVHLKTQAKLEKLLADLTTLPGLAELRSKSGITPLLLVASLPRNKTLAVRRHDVARELVARGVDVNAKDKQGRTAIHYAVLGGDLEMLDTLLSIGGNPMAIDRDGNSVFHYLTQTPPSLAEPILQRLQSLATAPDIHARNKQGKTALQLAQRASSESGGSNRRIVDALAQLATGKAAGPLRGGRAANLP